MTVYTNLNYISHQSQWEKLASVRTKPRVVLTKSEQHYWYPLEKQPICAHPFVMNLGEKAIKFILIQAAYRFMEGITEIETLVVNRVATAIANNNFHIPFTKQHSLDALTIIMDEAYHAYVAKDFIIQLESFCGVSPLAISQTTSLTSSVATFSGQIDQSIVPTFELIAVCLAENSITQSLGGFLNNSDAHPDFLRITRDHLSDEGRHSIYFMNILAYFWERTSDSIKCKIAEILPCFIHAYLKDEEQKKYDTQVLKVLGLGTSQIDTILSESCMDYSNTNLLHLNPMLKPILHVLKRSKLLDSPAVVSSLRKYGIINSENI